jgi:ribosome-binding factor A
MNVDLSSKDKKEAEFTAPNVDGYIVCELKVKDNSGQESSPSSVKITIIPAVAFESDLKNARPYNTIITKDKKHFEFVRLSKGSKIIIYNINWHKIAEIRASGDSVKWTIPDYLAAGVYIALIRDDKGQEKIIKIIVGQ